MAKKRYDETIDLDEHGGGGSGWIAWVLLVLVLGGGGYLYWSMVRPMSEEARTRGAAVADLTKRAGDAKKEADEAKAELQKAQDQMKQMQAELARSASQKTEDDKLLAQLKAQGGGAEIQDAAGKITVTLVDKILFKSGEAMLTPQGEQLLTKLGGVLANADKLIEVSGHADNQPVENPKSKQLFPTNWELSTTRATNVVRFLQEKVGLKPRRLKAAGFASYRPIASNASEKGRAKNRRIEILLLPDNMKVVKGDFSEEMAAAAPVAAVAKAKPAARKHK